jgi:hypothetical protein
VVEITTWLVVAVVLFGVAMAVQVVLAAWVAVVVHQTVLLILVVAVVQVVELVVQVLLLFPYLQPTTQA